MAVFTLTGATGSVGNEIVRQLLLGGHEVRVLSTRKELQWNGIKAYYWNPGEGIIDSAALEGADHLIHLAGATVSNRWTSKYKQQIMDSRVQSTQLLIDALSRLTYAPQSAVSASAIGYYGSDLERLMKEDDTPANDFLADVCRFWENYTEKLGNENTRSIQLRVGIVLDKGAGVLGQLEPLAKFGLASPLGSGKQWMSWIHVEDLARLFIHASLNEVKPGAYNAVASNPETNKAFTSKFCKAMKRPMLLPPVPGFVLKLVLGEMATLALMSQRVDNTKTKNTGFSFKYDRLEDALNVIYG
ncbi:MAG: hypothetical protein RL754_237 [Bacteroidota bacterium]|jgi:uncharacterized protein (TIGR01777 family)